MERFGDYVLLRPLARGGMGELFLARRAAGMSYSDLIVVKRILPELVAEGDFAEMFLTEGKVAALIDHPNVVHVHELGKVGAVCFMSMEYVAGKDLGTVLQRLGGPLALPLALWVVGGTCEGLAFAHDATDSKGAPLGLVHRDINPHNILISYSGAVKIADFGIARVQLARRAPTRAGVLKGKFGYLSPEQALGKPVDRRSDVFALGLLLFEVTTGRPAMVGNEPELLFQATRALVPRPSAIDPSYPRGLEQIVQRATARDPADRFQTARDLQRALLIFQLQQRLMGTAGALAELIRDLFKAEYEEEQRLAREAWLEGQGPMDRKPQSRAQEPDFAGEGAGDDSATTRVQRQDPSELEIEPALVAVPSDPATFKVRKQDPASLAPKPALADVPSEPALAPDDLAALSEPALVPEGMPAVPSEPGPSGGLAAVASDPQRKVSPAPPRPATRARRRLLLRLALFAVVIGAAIIAYLIISRP